MKYIVFMIKREVMILGHNWFRQLAFLIVFPMMIFFCISMPLYEIILIQTLNYLNWSIPGILILCSSMVCSNYGMRNILIFKDKEQYYQPLIESPMSLGQIVVSIYVVSILYGLVQFFFGSIILTLMNPGAFSVIQFLLIFLQLVAFLMFIGSFSLFLVFLIPNEEMSMYVLISLFLIIAFAFGALIPIELFPSELSAYLNNIPLVNIIINTQKILYMETPFYFAIFLNMVLAALFLLFSIILAYKSLRKI